MQEFVPGQVHDVGTLCSRGRVRMALTQRRLATLPPGGGAAVIAETTDEPELVARAAALLGRLGWHGPAQVEFVLDRRDGRPRLLEVNGRLWGTLALAVAAGLDVPVLACRLALDGDIPAARTYAVGLRFRWPFPEGLQSALRSPAPVRAVWRMLAPRRGMRSDLRWTDPWPHVAAAVRVGLGLARRGVRRGRGQGR